MPLKRAAATKSPPRPWGAGGGPGGGAEGAVGAQAAEVGARVDGYMTMRAEELPGEAQSVAVGVDRSREAEAMLGELRVQRDDHRVDAVVALGRKDRGAVAAVIGPGALEQGAALGWISSIPGS